MLGFVQPLTTRKTPLDRHLVVAWVIWPALLLLSSSAAEKTRYWYDIVVARAQKTHAATK